MKHTTQITDQVLRISLEGDIIGFEDVQGLLTEADDIIRQGVLLCVVDISAVRYMNSTGINILTTLLAKFRTQGGELVLTKPSQQVEKLLIVTKLTAIFTIAEDQHAAISRLKNESI